MYVLLESEQGPGDFAPGSLFLAPLAMNMVTYV